MGIKIRINARRTLNVTAVVLLKLTNFVPSKDVAVPKIAKVYQYLADTLFSKSRPIDIILGVDVFDQFVGSKKEAVSDPRDLRKRYTLWFRFVGAHSIL